jgi:hypothetical protein
MDGVVSRLAVYGDGADCHAGSSRFSYPDAMPTHQIVCWPKEGAIDLISGGRIAAGTRGFALDRFVAFREGWYYEEPPFDHALFECNGVEIVASLDRAKWGICRVGDGTPVGGRCRDAH